MNWGTESYFPVPHSVWIYLLVHYLVYIVLHFLVLFPTGLLIESGRIYPLMKRYWNYKTLSFNLLMLNPLKGQLGALLGLRWGHKGSRDSCLGTGLSSTLLCMYNMQAVNRGAEICTGRGWGGVLPSGLLQVSDRKCSAVAFELKKKTKYITEMHSHTFSLKSA